MKQQLLGLIFYHVTALRRICNGITFTGHLRLLFAMIFFYDTIRPHLLFAALVR